MAGPAPTRRAPLVALFVGLFIVVGVAAYLIWGLPKPGPAPDLTGAMTANVRGVGYMEQFDYGKAEDAFAEAVRLAPDWTPARVNLGIALLNQNNPDGLARAESVFREVLARDPDNRHAHYCLGIVLYHRGQAAEAHEQFTAVNRLDPEDGHTWYRLGMNDPDGPQSPAARQCFEQALRRNPNLNPARYSLAQALRTTDPKRAKDLLQEHTQLSEAKWEETAAIKYGEMGKYADVIGRDPSTAGKPVVGPVPIFESVAATTKLAPGVRWASAADLDPLRRAARERFGGTVVLFDFNGDGRPDVFLASAVVENGKVRDLLLRNEGGNSFTDVTAAGGLATPRPSLGAAAGDYDNDGHPDLIVTGAGEQHLFRNRGDGTFEDVTAAAGLDKAAGVCLGCGWADLDQDGDIDLILCRYAGQAEAVAGFTAGPAAGGGVELFENVGEAKPVPSGAPQPPLTTKFRRHEGFATIVGTYAAVAFVASDLDSDHDLDLLVLADGASPILLVNDRLMRFHKEAPGWAEGKAHRWNGGMVFTASHADRSDLLLVRADGPPAFLVAKGERDFVAGATNAPPLRQGCAADVDLDGWPDAVGLAADGTPALLHNQADNRLEYKPGAFGTAPPAVAVACVDLDGDGVLDLLLWSDTGLTVLRNAGNGNNALAVAPTGKRDQGKSERTNADGLGCWITAQAGPHWTAAERTTICAGLGQSLLPTTLGLGKYAQSDALRVRWPDGVLQSELLVSGRPVHRMMETNRQTGSCPVLMTWDGDRFVFVTDLLGAGSMGESGPDGSTRPPRPTEAIKIEPGQLKPKNGRLVLKLAEPMDEVLYLDHIQLDVIDHPADTVVFPDERFATADPQPTQELLAFREKHFPKRAFDHRDRDLTDRLLARDRRFADGFHLRSWIGFAEDHTLTLDFGELPKGPGGRWFLVLAGWSEYAYPESIYAAERAGVPLAFPVLESLAADGKTWESMGDLGFPAGFPRVMTRELAGLRPGNCVLRIRTNMQVYWDQAFLARAEDVGAKVQTLDVASADLAARGFMQHVYPDGRPPAAYDDAQTEPVPVTRWKGNLTRLGDVTDLLRAADDRFVLCGPGDEITVAFDTGRLPDLPAGWTRSFVLRALGYCKDAAPTTVTGGSIGPLPFRAMKNYPDFGGVRPPVTDADKWHTRPAAGR